MEHHAHVLVGNINDARKFVDSHGVTRSGNPDVWEREFDTFTISDARELKKRQQSRAISGGKKTIIVSFSFITVEAQNSLLKVFEEPTDGTHIIVAVPAVAMLLPTLLSRVEIVVCDKQENDGACEFMKATVAERQSMLKQMIEDKDKSGALALLSGIETELAANPKENKEKLKAVLEMKQYLYGRSPSVKSILEFVASFV